MLHPWSADLLRVLEASARDRFCASQLQSRCPGGKLCNVSHRSAGSTGISSRDRETAPIGRDAIGETRRPRRQGRAAILKHTPRVDPILSSAERTLCLWQMESSVPRLAYLGWIFCLTGNFV